MKIISVIENIADEYGGPANSLPNMLEALRKKLGIKSVIYSVSGGGDEKNQFIERFSIPWNNCKPNGPSKIKYSAELRSRLNSELGNGYIIFSNNLWNYPAFLSAFIAQTKALPHIVSIRGSLYPWSLSQGKLRKKIAWFLFQQRSLQRASLVHVTCADEYHAVRELGITSPVAIVPHGINYDDYQELPQKQVCFEHLNLCKEKKYVLFMSRLHKKKGLDLLLDVWVELVKEFPNWCLLVVGPDYSNYTKKINVLASDHMISDNIKVLGMLTGHDKQAVLGVSDIFTLPSYTENFGVVIGEAMAAGLPTITTTGVPWSEINSWNCGQQIELSHENLFNSMKSLMGQDENSLKTMSKNAKSLIKSNYSWSAQAEKFGQALNYVVNSKPAPGVVFLQGESLPHDLL